MGTKEYTLYYFSQLGTQRKPSVYKLLLEQRDNLIFDYRAKREKSKRNCCIIYFNDINQYAAICATLINNSDTSIGVVILDDNTLVKKLNLIDNSNSKNISIKLNECNYKKEVIPAPTDLDGEYLKFINVVRTRIKASSPSHSYLNPLTELKDLIIEHITLPYREK